jgi:hypothetical protein
MCGLPTVVMSACGMCVMIGAVSSHIGVGDGVGDGEGDGDGDGIGIGAGDGGTTGAGSAPSTMV